jgi:hypothetical protein
MYGGGADRIGIGCDGGTDANAGIGGGPEAGYDGCGIDAGAGADGGGIAIAGVCGRDDDGGATGAIGSSGVFTFTGAGGAGFGAAAGFGMATRGTAGAFGISPSVDPTPRNVRAGGRDAWNIGPSVPAAPSGRSKNLTAMPGGRSGPASAACTEMTRASTTTFAPLGEVSSSVTSAPFSKGTSVSMNRPPRLASRMGAFARSPPEARSYSISSFRATRAGYPG